MPKNPTTQEQADKYNREMIEGWEGEMRTRDEERNKRLLDLTYKKKTLPETHHAKLEDDIEKYGGGKKRRRRRRTSKKKKSKRRKSRKSRKSKTRRRRR